MYSRLRTPFLTLAKFVGEGRITAVVEARTPALSLVLRCPATGLTGLAPG